MTQTRGFIYIFALIKFYVGGNFTTPDIKFKDWHRDFVK